MRPKMPGVLLVLSFVSTGIVGQTTEQEAASFSAEVLREACENLVLAVRGLNPISQEDPGAMLCLGFIAGWSQAMEATDQQPFCLPDVARDRPGDIADLIVTWVDGNAPYYGSYFGRRNIKYRDHPNFRPIPTFESASGVPPLANGPVR